MCGIVGYVGSKKAIDILLEGLTNLEYRGYDSAGLLLMLMVKFSSTKQKASFKT